MKVVTILIVVIKLKFKLNCDETKMAIFIIVKWIIKIKKLHNNNKNIGLDLVLSISCLLKESEFFSRLQQRGTVCAN